MAYLVVILAAKSIARNEVSLNEMRFPFSFCALQATCKIILAQNWKTDLALFISGVKINPANVKLRNNLGMELKSAGRLEEAQHQYRVYLTRFYLYTTWILFT